MLTKGHSAQSLVAADNTYQMMISSYVNPKFSSRWLTLHSSWNTEKRQKMNDLVDRRNALTWLLTRTEVRPITGIITELGPLEMFIREFSNSKITSSSTGSHCLVWVKSNNIGECPNWQTAQTTISKVSAARAMQVCLLYFSTCLLYADLFGVDSLVVDGGYDYKRVGGNVFTGPAVGVVVCHLQHLLFMKACTYMDMCWMYEKRGW